MTTFDNSPDISDPQGKSSAMDRLRRIASKRNRLIAIAIFMVLYCLVEFISGGFIGPDAILVGLLLGALALGQLVSFLRDWTPFLVILFAWQMLRGYADNLATGGMFPVHITPMIDIDRALFGGQVPTVFLQTHLYTPGSVHWYDIATTMFWAFHFVLPLFFAFFLWARQRWVYWRFATTLIVLSFAAFATYVLYPAAPPWMASDQGYLIQPVFLLRDVVLRNIQVGGFHILSWIMTHGNPDSVAAMPSLHASYPTLVFWFSLFYWRKVTPLAVLYCLGLWFSVIYIGDHYVTDVLAGVVYATLAFFVMKLVFDLISRARRRHMEAAPSDQQANGIITPSTRT